MRFQKYRDGVFPKPPFSGGFGENNVANSSQRKIRQVTVSHGKSSSRRVLQQTDRSTKPSTFASVNEICWKIAVRRSRAKRAVSWHGISELPSF